MSLAVFHIEKERRPIHRRPLKIQRHAGRSRAGAPAIECARNETERSTQFARVRKKWTWPCRERWPGNDALTFSPCCPCIAKIDALSPVGCWTVSLLAHSLVRSYGVPRCIYSASAPARVTPPANRAAIARLCNYGTTTRWYSPALCVASFYRLPDVDRVLRKDERLACLLCRGSSSTCPLVPLVSWIEFTIFFLKI